jgi:glutamate racemase
MKAREFKSVGVLAGNSQGLAGIEKTILNANPDAIVVGIGLFPLVAAIEERMSPEAIVRNIGLDKILDFYRHMKMGTVILGCTHFSYIYPELQRSTAIPVFDPAESMYEIIARLS